MCVVIKNAHNQPIMGEMANGETSNEKLFSSYKAREIVRDNNDNVAPY